MHSSQWPQTILPARSEDGGALLAGEGTPDPVGGARHGFGTPPIRQPDRPSYKAASGKTGRSSSPDLERGIDREVECFLDAGRQALWLVTPRELGRQLFAVCIFVGKFRSQSVEQGV